MTEPLALSLGQQFELERMNRAIEATSDLETLLRGRAQLVQGLKLARRRDTLARITFV